MKRRLRRAPAKIAVSTLPPAAITPTAANWGEPAKTSADISTSDPVGMRAATASTPKEAPQVHTQTKKARAMGAAASRISLVDRPARIPSLNKKDAGAPPPASRLRY